MKSQVSNMLMEEGAEPEEQSLMQQALQKAREVYGSDQEYAGTDRVAKMIAQKMADSGKLVVQEGETPEMAQERLASGMAGAGKLGMQGGMAVGSVANVGRFSNVATNLAKELQAAKQASNLSQLGAKPAAQAMKTGTKMSPEEMKALAQAMLKKGM